MRFFLYSLIGVLAQISPYIIDAPVDQVYWCGGSVIVTADDDIVVQENEDKQHRKILFVTSNRGIVYRSLDYGVKWENVTAQIIEKHQLRADFRMKDVLQSPADSHIMYMIGMNASFVTYDCGKTYRPFNDQKLFQLRFNKLVKEQIIGFSEKKCNKTLKSCKELYKRQLWVTLNGGQDWKMILDHVRDAAWDKLIQYEMVPDNRLIVTHVDDDGQLLVSYSDDFFKTIRKIDSDAFGFYQTQQYLFLLVRPDPFSTGYDLKISPHLGDSYFPQEIVLPVDDLSKHTFTVLDVTDSQVYLSVSHAEEFPKITNVYMSDGSEFTVSLLGNVRSEDTGHCDFEKIKSMRGLYISNVFASEEIERSKQRRKRVTSEKDIKEQDHLDQYKKSLITFDFGAEWHAIKAPKYTLSGQALNCNGDCSLHLRGRTETKSMIYSSEEAIGIIIATGNTGIYLNSRETNTYLSRDGGHTWYEILNGSHIYEIGDHGGVMVFASTDSPADKIKYTLDEGLNFSELKLKMNITVENIVTEPSNQELKFLVYGRIAQERQDDDIINRFDTLKGVLFPIDLSQQYTRQCKGEPGEPDSDYEYWMPLNYMQQKCLFGQKIKYQRRKRDAKCKSGDIEKKIIVESCPCTREDWECDMGYVRKLGGDCVLMTQAFEVKPQQVKCKGTYVTTQGYRKIPGDSCEGGINLGPITLACPEEDSQEQAQSNLKQTFTKNNTNQYQRPTSADQQQYTSDSGLSIQEFLSQYLDYILVVVGITVLFCMRGWLLECIKNVRGTQNIKKHKHMNYYPPNEEEIQAARKKQSPMFELMTSKEEDEEAGL